VSDFVRARGTARFAYARVLAVWRRQYLAGEKSSEAAPRRQFSSVKHEPFP
jgi:hypothetical protein